MPKLELPESKILLERLRRYYQNAEQELLNTIFYQRGRGLIDYAQAAAVERVQRILTQLQNDCWTYVPRLIELSFYENHPEAARLFEPAGKHRVGYENALVLTGEQTAIVSTLTANLMGELLQASETATASSHTAIGRLSADGYRRAGLSAVATMEAAGRGPQQGVARMIASLRAEGITAFTDRAGRHWSLSHYTDMSTAAGMSTQKQVQFYQSMISSVEREMLRLDVINEAGANRSDALLAAGKGETDSFHQLDAAMERAGVRYRELAEQKEVLCSKIDAVTAAIRQEQAELAQTPKAVVAPPQVAQQGVSQVQTNAGGAIQSLSQQFSGSAASVQQYAQEISNIDRQLLRMSTDMTITSQRLSEVSAAQGAGSAAAQALKTELSGQVQQTQNLTDRQGRLKTMLMAAAGSSRNAAQAMEQYQGSMNRAANSSSGLINQVKNMVGAYLGMRGLTALTEMSDQMVQTKARLDMMNDGLQTTEALQEMIYQSAQRSRGAYAETADMVAKLGVLAGDAFGSNQETAAFAEQLNKHFIISGTSATGRQAAMLQLTQAMSAGVLRGEELKSVLEQVPTVVQSISDYLGVSTGELREMASEGQLSASLVKNALFAMAEETNGKFETMPMTWAQVWSSMQNTALMALQPLLTGINWLANHLEEIAPVLAGASAGALVFAAALGIQAAASWIATGAAQAFFATLLTNPLTYIVLAVGIVVAALYNWIQSVGGVKIAWQIAANAILTTWDAVKIGFYAGVYWVQGLLDSMGLAFQTAGVNIQNFLGDMKVGALSILQSMVNGAIGILNSFIGELNKIPGVNIGVIEQVTFASTAAVEHEAAKQARAVSLAAAQKFVLDAAAGREAALTEMRTDAWQSERSRLMGIAAMRAENATQAVDTEPDYAGMAQDIGAISDNTGKIAKNTANTSDEDLKYREDVAIRRYVTKINTTSLTPSITVNVKGEAGKSAAYDIAAAIADILARQAAAHTSLSYAEV